MTERVVLTGAEGKFPIIRRALPTTRPGDGRTINECAVAARMLLKLRRGDDVRRPKVRSVQEAIYLDRVYSRAKLDRALDHLLDDLEAAT